jgi:MFS family permease
MLVAGMLVVAGTLGVAMSGNLILMGICRLVTGIGIGAASAVVPGYIVENRSHGDSGPARDLLAVRHRHRAVRRLAERVTC